MMYFEEISTDRKMGKTHNDKCFTKYKNAYFKTRNIIQTETR